jgi:hypothetical protein
MADPTGIRDLLLSRVRGAGAPTPDAPATDDPGTETVDPIADAMGQLIDAVKSGDAAGAADAFRMAFKACELEPQMEGGEQE